MKPPDEPVVRISTFSRVLAWVLLACCALMMVLWVLVSLKTGHPDWRNAGYMLLVIGVMAALFAYPAIKGRAPRWSTFIENAYEREAARRGIPVKLDDGGRRVVFATAALVFGITLLGFGTTLRLFEGDTGWFAAAVFCTAWLIVTIVLWRNLGKPRSA